MTTVVYGACPACGLSAEGGALIFDDFGHGPSRVVACACGSRAAPVPLGAHNVRHYVDERRYRALEQLEKAVRDVEAIVADCPGIATALAAVNAAPPLRHAA